MIKQKGIIIFKNPERSVQVEFNIIHLRFDFSVIRKIFGKLKLFLGPVGGTQKVLIRN